MAGQPYTDVERAYIAWCIAHGFSSAETARLVTENVGTHRTKAGIDSQRRRDDLVLSLLELFEVAGEGTLDADHPELRALERTVTVLKDERRDLRSKLAEADKAQHLLWALADVVRDSTRPIDPDPPEPRAKKEEGATPVSMVALLSDTHADMVVEREHSWGMEGYGFRAFRCRLEVWAKLHIDYIRRHLPRHDVEDLWVLGLGDWVHGDIHGHGPFNEFKNTVKAALATGDVLAEALYWIHRSTGVPIRFIGVSGNHGRRSKRKDYDHPHDNFDFLTMAQAATRLDQLAPAIEIILPESYTAFARIRGKLWAMNHGDDVVGYAGFPWYGFSRKNNRVQALVGRLDERIRFFVYGHYHTKASASENAHESIHNGAFPLTDPYAQQKLAVGTTPLQRTFIVDDERPGPILELPIYLVNEEYEQRVYSGEEEPVLGRHTILDQVRPGFTSDGLQVVEGP